MQTFKAFREEVKGCVRSCGFVHSVHRAFFGGNRARGRELAQHLGQVLQPDELAAVLAEGVGVHLLGLGGLQVGADHAAQGLAGAVLGDVLHHLQAQPGGHVGAAFLSLLLLGLGLGARIGAASRRTCGNRGRLLGGSARRDLHVFQPVEQFFDAGDVGQVAADHGRRVLALLDDDDARHDPRPGALESHGRQPDVGHQVQIRVLGLALGVLGIEPLVELRISRSDRDQGHDPPAIVQVLGGFGHVVNGQPASRAEGRVHYHRVVLVDDVMILEVASLDVALEHQGNAAAKRHLALDHSALDRLREPPRDGAMAAAGLQRAFSAAQVGPLHHLQAHGLGRGEVVLALFGLGAAALLLRATVEGLGAVPLGGHGVDEAVARLAALALAFMACAVVVAFLEGADEGVAQRAGGFTRGQVLGRAGALGDGLRERGALPRRSGVQVALDGVRDLAGTVDAAFLLDGHGGLGGQAQVEQHALVLAGGVVAAPALVLLRLHQHDLGAAGVVVEGLVAGQDVARLLQAVDQQHAGQVALETLDGRDQVGQQLAAGQVRKLGVELGQRLVVLLGLARGVAFGSLSPQRCSHHLLRDTAQGERVPAATLVEVVEDNHLAAHGHVLADVRDHLLGFDRLQQVAPHPETIGAVQLVGEHAVERCPAGALGSLAGASVGLAFLAGLLRHPVERVVDAPAHSRLHQHETAVVVGRHVQRALAQDAALLQPAVELALQQPTVELGVIGLGELVHAHPVSEVRHEEVFARVRPVVAVARLVVGVAFPVVEQVALGQVDRLLVGKGRGRQHQHPGTRRTLAGLDVSLHGLARCVQRLRQRALPRLQALVLFPQRHQHLVHGVGVVHDLDVRVDALGQIGKAPDVCGMQHLVARVGAAGVVCDRTKRGQRLGGIAVLALGQAVRLVGNHQAPVAVGHGLVVAQVGVGRDRDARAGVLGGLQRRHVQAQRLGRIHPVGHDLLVRHDDERVGLALAREALDDAQAREGLAGSGAVGEEDPVAVRLREPRLGLADVFLLTRQQVGQRGGDVLRVARDYGDGVGCALGCGALVVR